MVEVNSRALFRLVNACVLPACLFGFLCGASTWLLLLVQFQIAKWIEPDVSDLDSQVVIDGVPFLFSFWNLVLVVLVLSVFARLAVSLWKKRILSAGSNWQLTSFATFVFTFVYVLINEVSNSPDLTRENWSQRLPDSTNISLWTSLLISTFVFGLVCSWTRTACVRDLPSDDDKEMG